VLERILKNIREHLLQSHTVPTDHNRRRRCHLRQVHAALPRKLAKRARRILDDRSKIEAHDFEVKIAAPRSLGV
jgi:hypothetical protein